MRLLTRLVALVAAGLLASSCTGSAASDLITDPDIGITASAGDIRVITYTDDPPVDGWRPIVTPIPDVVRERERFREDSGGRLLAAEEAGRQRIIFLAEGPGRTLYVEQSNDGSVRGWAFTVGESAALRLDASASLLRAEAEVAVGTTEVFILERAPDAEVTITVSDEPRATPVEPLEIETTTIEVDDVTSIEVLVVTANGPSQAVVTVTVADGSETNYTLRTVAGG